MNPEQLLPVLAEMLIKGTAILAAAALLHRAASRASAAFHHTLWAAAFAALLLLPLTKLVSPCWTLGLQRGVDAPAESLSSSEVSAVTAGPEVTPAGSIATLALADRPKTDWSRVVLGVWLTGVVGLLGHRLLGSFLLWRLKRRSAVLADPRLAALARSAAAGLAISRAIEVRVSTERCGPITWGSWRPVLLLPSECAQWSDERSLAALRHELGHIARQDFFTRWFVSVATAIHWPNPGVWFAGRLLRRLQERACDDVVLSSGIESQDYASLLVETARSFRVRGLAERLAVAMARPSSLEDRVVAIVDEDRERGPAGRWAYALAASMVGISLSGSALAQVEEKGKEPSAAGLGVNNPNPPGLEALASGLFLKEFIVPAEFLQRKLVAPVNLNGALAREARIDFAESVKRLGITFPAGASAVYIAATQRLIMRNTQENHDLLEKLLLAASPEMAATVATKHPLFDKLERIVIPQIEFREMSVRESLAHLEKKAKEFDPEKIGVTFTTDAIDESMATRITISLRNIPVLEVIKYITSLGSLKFRVTDRDVLVESLGGTPAGSPLLLKEYQLPDKAVQPDGTIVGPNGAKYAGARELLVAFGITFPEGTTAAFTSGGKTLAARHTEDSLSQIDVVVAGLIDAKGSALPASELRLLDKTILERRGASKMKGR